MVGESDQSLMSRVRIGDRRAYGRLLERYWAPLTTYAAGIVGGEDDAKDVVQDVFIRVWRFRSEWSAEGTVGGYLYRITKNLALNASRHGRSEMKRRDQAGDRASRSGPATPHEDLEATLLRQDVDAAIDALPDRRRDVFILSRFHGLSHREIGEAMGISSQTVANQMSAALEELRDTLSSHLDRH